MPHIVSYLAPGAQQVPTMGVTIIPAGTALIDCFSLLTVFCVWVDSDACVRTHACECAAACLVFDYVVNVGLLVCLIKI